MGKSKNKSRRNKGPCPTGLPSVKETVQELGETEVQPSELSLGALNGHGRQTPGAIKASLESIIEKLQGKGVEEKHCACCALGVLCHNDEAIPILMQSNVVKVVSPFFLDSNPTVSHATVGAMRTLSACSDHELCEAMVEQDVMTPLVALFKKKYCPFEWKPAPPVEDKIDSTKEIFVEAVQMLWNLCGSSSRAVKIFCKENLLRYLMPCLNVEVYRHDVVCAVAYCLYTVSEDNAEIAANLNETANTEIIYSLLNISGSDSLSTLLRVLAAGIILNMNCNKLTGCSPLVVATMMTVLNNALAVNVMPLLSPTLKKLRESEDSASNEEISIEKLISAQQVALEILINICCGDDDGENWDNTSSSDNNDDVDPLGNSSMECDDAEREFPCSIPTEVHEAIVSHNLLGKVLAKVQFLDEELKVNLDQCKIGQRIFKNLMILQSRSFLCLNNLTTCLDLQELGGPEALYKLWVDIGKFVFEQSGKSRLELLEPGTSAMSSILKKLAEEKSNQFEQFSMSDLQKLYDIVQQVSDARIKVNVIRIVGSLGFLLSTSVSPNSALLVKSIGLFLLEIGGKNDKVWVESEALDCLMDVFAEDETHQLSLEIGLVDKLRTIFPAFKQRINFQLKKLGDHLPVVMSVKTNLARFIKYKTSFNSSSNGRK